MSYSGYIIAIGASAGGLEPCERFFDKAPVDKGFAYVVIQHLSPDFRSLMDELLARHSSMPIHRAQDGMKIEPNTIYLNGPRQVIGVRDGHFVVTPDEEDDIIRMPIDSFFTSLAQHSGSKAIGVILSGSGSDGMRGCRAIKAEGGRVFVQTPESAKFDSMPLAALSTRLADADAAPADMPGLIVSLLGMPREPAETPPVVSDDPVADIMGLLQTRFGTDFRCTRTKRSCAG